MFILYMNDAIYGRGSSKYVVELINSYVVDSEMYGRDECDFKIVRVDDEQMDKLLTHTVE